MFHPIDSWPVRCICARWYQALGRWVYSYSTSPGIFREDWARSLYMYSQCSVLVKLFRLHRLLEYRWGVLLLFCCTKTKWDDNDDNTIHIINIRLMVRGILSAGSSARECVLQDLCSVGSSALEVFVLPRSIMLQAVYSDANHVTKTLSYQSGFSLRGSGRCWLFRVSNFLSILCCSCLPRRLQCARACIDKFLRSLRTH